MDFVVRLRPDLIIITNRSNLIDFDEVEKTAKNMKSISLINKNILVIFTTSIIIKIKKLKIQILELKIELKDFKYIFWEDHKLSLNIEENKKLLYKGSNQKSVNKRNLKYYKYDKKDYFKFKCRIKPKN